MYTVYILMYKLVIVIDKQKLLKIKWYSSYYLMQYILCVLLLFKEISFAGARVLAQL